MRWNKLNKLARAVRLVRRTKQARWSPQYWEMPVDSKLSREAYRVLTAPSVTEFMQEYNARRAWRQPITPLKVFKWLSTGLND